MSLNKVITEWNPHGKHYLDLIGLFTGDFDYDTSIIRLPRQKSTEP